MRTLALVVTPLLTAVAFLTPSPALSQRSPAIAATHIDAEVLALACAPVAATSRPTATLRISGGQDTYPRLTFSQGDFVTLNAGSNQGLQVGQEFFVRRLRGAPWRLDERGSTRHDAHGRLDPRLRHRRRHGARHDHLLLRRHAGRRLPRTPGAPLPPQGASPRRQARAQLRPGDPRQRRPDRVRHRRLPGDRSRDVAGDHARRAFRHVSLEETGAGELPRRHRRRAWR